MVFTGAVSGGDRVASPSQMETAADRRIMPEIAGRDGNKHMTAMLDDDIAELRHANAELSRRLDERTAERDEAEAQKAALAEVLEVINSSPGDLAPVFDVMLEKAMRLCEAAFGVFQTFDGETVHPVAMRNVPPDFAACLRTELSQAGSTYTVIGSAISEQRTITVEDYAATEAY